MGDYFLKMGKGSKLIKKVEKPWSKRMSCQFEMIIVVSSLVTALLSWILLTLYYVSVCRQ